MLKPILINIKFFFKNRSKVKVIRSNTNDMFKGIPLYEIKDGKVIKKINV
jgi:hypothetical protein